MGYYTDYTINIEPYPYKTVPKISETEVLQWFCDHVDCGEWEEWGNGLYSNRKWYDMDKDMQRVSEKFPEYLFHISGNGEEADDLWEAHWWNGYAQYCYSAIPPFDPTQLRYHVTGEFISLEPEKDVQLSSDIIGLL